MNTSAEYRRAGEREAIAALGGLRAVSLLHRHYQSKGESLPLWSELTECWQYVEGDHKALYMAFPDETYDVRAECGGFETVEEFEDAIVSSIEDFMVVIRVPGGYLVEVAV